MPQNSAAKRKNSDAAQPESSSNWPSWQKIFLVGALIGLIVCPFGLYFALPLVGRNKGDGAALAPVPNSFDSKANFFPPPPPVLQQPSPVGDQCEELPKFITAAWINPTAIVRVSQFRSQIGHPFVSDRDKCFDSKNHGMRISQDPLCCASEKHYAYLREDRGLPNVYAPCNGKIIRIEHENMGTQVWISPKGYEDYAVRVFHINTQDGPLQIGDVVTAGQKLGRHFTFHTFSDIAVEHYGSQYGLTSVFCHMTREVLSLFGLRPEDVQEKMIISREQRAAHPIPCSYDRDVKSVSPYGPDWVDISPTLQT